MHYAAGEPAADDAVDSVRHKAHPPQPSRVCASYQLCRKSLRRLGPISSSFYYHVLTWCINPIRLAPPPEAGSSIFIMYLLWIQPL
jgi:hypothetical protein